MTEHSRNRQATKMIVLFVILYLLAIQESFAQSHADIETVESPNWVTAPPIGYLNFYFVGFSESNNLEEAKLLSEEDAKAQVRAKRSGVSFSDIHMAERYVSQSGSLYRVWTLVSYPRRPEEQMSPPTSFSPVWRSAIIPGWGQFYKNQSIKGALIIATEALMIPAGMILGNLKINADADGKNSRTQALRDYYVDQANTYNNLSIASFILAGVVYVYNIVDAVVSEGEKVYVQAPNFKLNADMVANVSQLRLSVLIPL